MSVILGIGPPCSHDPSAALVVDGKLIAAAEEERFIRRKHARDELPLHAVQYCLQQAGLRPDDVQYVTFGWSPEACHRAKWFYAARMCSTNLHMARKVITKASKINRLKAHLVEETVRRAGISPGRVRIVFVEHHVAHAASASLLSGFPESAFMSIDGGGEFITTLIGEVVAGQLRRLKELYYPDSLGLFYAAVTEYLGFESNDGEYKTMGMAPYGNPEKIDLSEMIQRRSSGFRVHPEHVGLIESARHRADRMYSQRMVEWFGQPRSDDGLAEPYIHVAAAAQQALEEAVIALMERYLSESLKRHGTLCLAGGCALNVTMNRKLLSHPLVKRLFVQPAAHDAGTSLGAAVFLASQLGEPCEPMRTASYGPAFTMDRVRATVEVSGLPYRVCPDPAEEAAELLARGAIVGWFQGRMEFGPRALGNRSILGHPAIKGTADQMNTIVKFRERWRPFCPSVLQEHAAEIFGTSHEAAFMTLSFLVNDRWRSKIPEVVHVDGSVRPQTLTAEANPIFYRLVQRFHDKTGIPLVMNTSLNRRGEPMVCSPEDALAMFHGCGLEYLFLEDYLVSKRR